MSLIFQYLCNTFNTLYINNECKYITKVIKTLQTPKHLFDIYLCYQTMTHICFNNKNPITYQYPIFWRNLFTQYNDILIRFEYINLLSLGPVMVKVINLFQYFNSFGV